MPDSARFASVFVFAPLAPVVVSSSWVLLCAAHTGGGDRVVVLTAAPGTPGLDTSVLISPVPAPSTAWGILVAGMGREFPMAGAIYGKRAGAADVVVYVEVMSPT